MRWLPDSALDHLREVAAEPDLSGTPYEIAEVIGRGGMGTVYLARDRELDREVALKVVQLPEDAEASERMLREARILARLEHPGIVPVHDVGVLPDGRAWYVMKRVRGSRLDEHARSLSLNDRLRAFERICEAVAFAHANGVIHRDLKPENVMVGPFGEVLVLDWGIAKAGTSEPPPQPSPATREREHSSTLQGTVMGTPGYMAPEQERGEIDRIDERTDVYGLGAMLAFLLRDEDVPRPLKAIRQRAMAAEREDRYAGVQELMADLGRYLDGLSVAAYQESVFEQVGRFVRRHRTPILIVVAYLLMRALLILVLGR